MVVILLTEYGFLKDFNGVRKFCLLSSFGCLVRRLFPVHCVVAVGACCLWDCFVSPPCMADGHWIQTRRFFEYKIYEFFIELLAKSNIFFWAPTLSMDRNQPFWVEMLGFENQPAFGGRQPKAGRQPTTSYTNPQIT